MAILFNERMVTSLHKFRTFYLKSHPKRVTLYQNMFKIQFQNSSELALLSLYVRIQSKPNKLYYHLEIQKHYV